MPTQPLAAAGEAEVDDELEACHALLDDLTPLPSPVRVAARSLQLQEDEGNKVVRYDVQRQTRFYYGQGGSSQSSTKPAL